MNGRGRLFDRISESIGTKSLSNRFGIVRRVESSGTNDRVVGLADEVLHDPALVVPTVAPRPSDRWVMSRLRFPSIPPIHPVLDDRIGSRTGIRRETAGIGRIFPRRCNPLGYSCGTKAALLMCQHRDDLPVAAVSDHRIARMGWAILPTAFHHATFPSGPPGSGLCVRP